MAYTEQDMQKQVEAFAQLQDEFSRLESTEKALRKQLGMPEKGGAGIDMQNLTAEQKALVSQAQAEAERAGKARATQSAPASSAGGIPGAGRRGAMRL